MMFHILFLISLGFTLQVQAAPLHEDLIRYKEDTEKMMKLVEAIGTRAFEAIPYKFVNLTDSRALVKYDRDTPFLQKGYEVRPGACLYIHQDDFNHLSIFLFIEGSTQTLCNYKGTTICHPADYTLIYPPDVIETDATPDPPVVKELSYTETGRTSENENTPAIEWEKIHRFVLMKKRTNTTEECGVF